MHTATGRQIERRLIRFLKWIPVVALTISLYQNGNAAKPKRGAIGGRPTGAPDELAIHYTYVHDTTDGYDGDFWGDYGDLEGALRRAFAQAGIKLFFLLDSIPVRHNAVFSKEDALQFYLQHPPDSAYPYLVVGIRSLKDSAGQVDPTVLGFTPSFASSPGNIQSNKCVFVARESIRNSVDQWFFVSTYHPQMFAYVVLHELGHVRAQLRHVDKFPEDHVPSNESGYNTCVMHVIMTLPWTRDPESRLSPTGREILNTLRFCGQGSTDSTSCYGVPEEIVCSRIRPKIGEWKQ